jgi:hypothetical protein
LDEHAIFGIDHGHAAGMLCSGEASAEQQAAVGEHYAGSLI